VKSLQRENEEAFVVAMDVAVAAAAAIAAAAAREFQKQDLSYAVSKIWLGWLAAWKMLQANPSCIICFSSTVVVVDVIAVANYYHRGGSL